MNITKTQNGETTILTIEGRLDTNTSDTLAAKFAALFESGANAIILDFASLVYLSSAGLRVLLTAQKKLSAAGGSMLIKNCSEFIYDIFETTGFTNIMQIES